jgi:uncharacterized protein YggE
MPRLPLYEPIAAPTQSQRASSDRKTIEITATEKVQVAADVATIKVGYQNLSATKDAAYTENTRTVTRSDQPTKYLASQEWQIHSAASDAQKIVDIAIAAGANQTSSGPLKIHTS